MDLDDFRSILETSGVDVWTFIDTAIEVASIEFNGELKRRRDGIVERLYEATTSSDSSGRCRNCEANRLKSNALEINVPIQNQRSPEVKIDDADLDPYGGILDDEQIKILEIKEQLEDLNQVYLLFLFPNP